MSKLITVSGLPGTGTSTLCRLLETKLNVPYLYAGQIFRNQAAKKGMTLAEFGQLCELEDSVDRGLDDEQVRLLKSADEQGLILEGRLSGWLAHQNHISALKIWVSCEENERVRRLVERDGGDPADQLASMHARQASENTRYQTYYGIQLTDMSPYDLILDSTHQSPAEMATLVMATLRSD
jgi:cytidylate kinase